MRSESEKKNGTYTELNSVHTKFTFAYKTRDRTFARNFGLGFKINARENATVPTSLSGREKLRLETSVPPLGRSRLDAVASSHNLRATLAIRSCPKSMQRAAVLPVTAVADNRVSASERTATTVQVCRNASMFPAASLMDFHICASFQLRRVSYSTASSRLS